MATAIDAASLYAMLTKLPLFSKVKKSTLSEKNIEKLLDTKRLVFRVCETGEYIVRQDSLDTEFYVLVEGLCTAYRTEEDGATTPLASYGAGEWFGEMACLSHQARTASIKADAPTTILVVDITLFQQLYEDQTSSFFSEIEKRYRERALQFHLRTAPVFKKLPKEYLSRLADGAELITYPKDKVIAEQDSEADAIYLVRSGIVKRTKEAANGAEILQGYLCDNSSFGERALATNRGWPSSYTSMSRVDVVRLPRTLIQEVLGESSDALKDFQAAVWQLLAQEAAVAGAPTSEEEMEVLIGKQTIKGGEALVIDLKKCTRCNACVESCVAVHADHVPRLSKRGIRAGSLELSSACYNCKTPDCMLSCKFGAIRRDVTGQIHVMHDNCVGCCKCEAACPYGVIRMAELIPGATLSNQERSFMDMILGGLFGIERPKKEDPNAPKPETKAIKCDLCAGMPFEACVYNCPCTAISRVSPEKLVGFGAVSRKA